MKQFLYALILFTILSIAYSDRPVVGIFTEPSLIKGYDANHYSYIASAYAKYFWKAGAMAIPIPYDADKETLKRLFYQINGLFFPGGAVEITRKNLFTENAKFMFDLAIKSNNEGVYFPVWGTCLGFQLLHTIVGGFKPNILTTIEKQRRVKRELKIVNPGKLFADMSKDERKLAQKYENTFYNHKWIVTDEAYEANTALDKFFVRTAYSENVEGVEFIASVEARNYPIYGVLFHPEKKTNKQLRAYFALFFVNECRKNTHSFYSADELEDWDLGKYDRIKSHRQAYGKVYILQNFDTTIGKRDELIPRIKRRKDRARNLEKKHKNKNKKSQKSQTTADSASDTDIDDRIIQLEL